MFSSEKMGLAEAPLSQELLVTALRGWGDRPAGHGPVPLASEAHYDRLAALIVEGINSSDGAEFARTLRYALRIIDQGALIRGLCQKSPADRPFDVAVYIRLTLALEGVER
jgi:hypothetical protein